jgi:hypothetical protein
LEIIMADYSIQAAARGTGTFTLAAGQVATVTAVGSWLCHPHGAGGQCGAGGNGVPSHGSYPAPGAPEGCLVYEWGGAGIAAPSRDYFRNDTGPTTMNNPGLYTFIANDNDMGDNNGAIAIHVNIA